MINRVVYFWENYGDVIEDILTVRNQRLFWRETGNLI